LIGLTPSRSIVQSLNYAFDGVIHTLATQRNMRIHFGAAMLALIACAGLGVSREEFALVFLAASFVIAAEMLNTAVEAAIDVATTSFNPLAKIAKDVAAGAVLIAASTAVVVGFLVFGDKVGNPSTSVLEAVRDVPVNVTFIAITLTFLATIVLKTISGRGTALRGGFPSGHAAISFAGWMAVTFLASSSDFSTLISSVAFGLALLVCHTRVESGVHTWGEVVAGAILGSLVTLAVFQLSGFGA
jgi:diacylglycerol kinase (ATP)